MIPANKTKITRKQYIKMLEEEYRALTNIEVEVGKRKNILHEQIDKLKDEEVLSKMEERKIEQN